MMVFALIGGVIADRVNRRKLMMCDADAMMMLAFTLWVLALTHRITMPADDPPVVLNGLAMSLNTPAYQAIVPSLVPREDLTNAIALNSAQFNMSRIIGPTIGGLAMAYIGIANNFLLNALSFIAVLIALMKITYPPVYPPGDTTLWETMSDGFLYLSAAAKCSCSQCWSPSPASSAYLMRPSFPSSPKTPASWRKGFRTPHGFERRRSVPRRGNDRPHEAYSLPWTLRRLRRSRFYVCLSLSRSRPT